ncbi:imelysin family protein [Vibrio sonorensis]|uniref:imelysin family protein n=1 Tax=Vibrio sonorensis TaxID=1004316 RepID=UPI001FE1496F|nr:imelysin family protein [Vibrio sonorensis]
MVMPVMAEASEHASHGVYQVERSAAKVFESRAEKLENAFIRFCRGGTRDELEEAWQQTMLSWMALQGQERGPAKALEQSWNVQFWPDKKNTTGRKMSSLIAQDKVWTEEEISVQSVTVQGLGAMEWLLYDKASTLETGSSVCKTGANIAKNLSTNATHINTAWKSNPWLALDEKGWNTEYIALLSNQLDYSMKKLSRPLAKTGKPRAYFSESWRSERSMHNLKANIEAMELLYFANGNGLDKLLRDRNKVALADSIKKQFRFTIDTWPTEPSLFTALQSKDGYVDILAQYNKLEQLKYLIHEEVAIELGVIIGFNATDGD